MKNTSDNEIRFRQLGGHDELSPGQLRDISELIYETDDYIYPAMFARKEDALLLIPEMFRMGDEMFRAENLFAAFRGEAVVGLILWKKGPMGWTPDIYESAAETHGVPRPRFLDKVKKEYFAAYAETGEETAAVINVCIAAAMRGAGVGRRMLEAFLRETEGACGRYELFVLADNLPACKLYRDAGFEVVETLSGFCVEPRELRCYRMMRT